MSKFRLSIFIDLMVWMAVVFFLVLLSFWRLDSLRERLLILAGFLFGTLMIWIDQKWLWQYYFSQQQFLITRSFLFLLSLVVFSIWLVTSENSLIAKGWLLGVWWPLVWEMSCYQRDPQAFYDRFLSQVKRIFLVTEIDGLVIGFWIWQVFLWIMIWA